MLLLKVRHIALARSEWMPEVTHSVAAGICRVSGGGLNSPQVGTPPCDRRFALVSLQMRQRLPVRFETDASSKSWQRRRAAAARVRLLLASVASGLCPALPDTTRAGTRLHSPYGYYE
jgi:hypothetical protein